MKVKTTPFDPANYLNDEHDIPDYLADTDEQGGAELMLAATGDLERARALRIYREEG